MTATNLHPTYEIGQRFTFAKGDAVLCSGYPGIVSKVCDGVLAGMVEVKLARGCVCVSASYPEVLPAPTGPAVKLGCDMTEGCTECVTHVDDKGFVYCKGHGLQRRAGGTPCRALRKREIATLLEGGVIRYR